MNKFAKITASLLLLAPAFNAFSAPLTLPQERQVKLSALRLIEGYESYSTMRSDEAEEEFRYIFNNDTLPIFNDLNGLADGRTLTVDRYITTVKSTTGAKVVIKNITHGAIEDGGSVWLIPVKFHKEIQYNHPRHDFIVLSSYEYYGEKDYIMTAMVSCDKTTFECHIVSLTGSIDSNRARLESSFHMVTKRDPRDENTTLNGKPLGFDRFGQRFVSLSELDVRNNIRYPNFRYPDDDIKVSYTNIDDVTWKLKYIPTRWRVRPWMEMGLGGAYAIETPSPQLTATSSGMQAGVDFGFVFPSRGMLKVGIFTGLGYSTGKIDLALPSLSYSTDGYDVDGDSYTHFFELSNMSQSLSLSHAVVPLYGEMEMRLHSRFSLYAQAGVKAFLSMSTKVTGLNYSVYSYGLYPQYGNLKIEESWINGFGSTTLGVNDLYDSDYSYPLAIDVMAGVGARVKLFGPVSLDLGVSYNQQVNGARLYEGGEVTTLPSGASSYGRLPIYPSGNEGLRVSNTLVEFCAVKPAQLNLKAGLTFKF